MKKTISVLLALLCAVSLAACTSLGSTKEEKAAALSIRGYDVPYEMLRYAAMNALKDKVTAGLEVTDEFKASDEGKTLNRELLDDALAALCITYGVFGLSEDRGIDPYGDALGELVESALLSKTSAYASDRELKDALAASGMTLEVLRTLVRYEVVYNEIYDDMKAKGDIVTDAAALRGIFAGDGFICVKVLCFSTDNHTIGECRELAATASEALKAGADFDGYVQAHGEMIEMAKNTDGLYVCRGIWREEVENAAFALGVGEISAPIESPDGVRILLRCEKSAEYIENNFENLCDTYEEGVFRTEIEAAVEKATASAVLPEGFYDRSVFDMKVG